MKHAESSEPGRAYCGKVLTPEFFTLEWPRVTCASCIRTRSPETQKRSWANKKSRLSPGYADSSFTGTGALKCALCGNPIRDHPGWPCSLRVDILR